MKGEGQGEWVLEVSQRGQLFGDVGVAKERGVTLGFSGGTDGPGGARLMQESGPVWLGDGHEGTQTPGGGRGRGANPDPLEVCAPLQTPRRRGRVWAHSSHSIAGIPSASIAIAGQAVG